MADLDIFYGALDRRELSHRSLNVTTSGVTVLNAEGADVVLANPAALVPGTKVLLYDGLNGIACCYVKKVTDPTHISVVPLKSALDTIEFPYTFPNGSVVSTTIGASELAAQIVVDLSEASEDTYDFLLVACGAIEINTANATFAASLRSSSLQDDPYSGGDHGGCVVTAGTNSFERVNFVAATRLSGVGGQRYEPAVHFQAITPNAQASIVNSRIIALRVSGGYFAGDGRTAEATTTSGALQDYLTLPQNLPAGDYLIVSTWTLGSASGVAAECQLEIGASGILAQQNTAPIGANNFIPGGFCGIVSLGAANHVRLRYRSPGGGISRIRNAFLAAVPVANIPALAATHVVQDLNTVVSQSLGTSFMTIANSGNVAIESGRHIEIISVSVGGNAAFRSRPVFVPETGLGANNLPPFGTGTDNYHPTFWFRRVTRSAGTARLALEARAVSGTATVRARDFTWSWIREKVDFRPEPSERMAVIADVELGGRVLKNWNSTTTVGRFSHRLSDVDNVSRVMVNGDTLTRVRSLAAMTAGTWFWNAADMTIYVQLAPGVSPSDDGVVVVVVPLLLVAREKETLIDAWSGDRVTYRPMIEGTPGARHTLRSNRARFSTSTQLGALELVAAHGEFDDQIVRANFDGFRVRIRRGYTRKTRNVADFEVVADAVMGKPQSDFERITFELLDRRLIMQAPIANTRITVHEGYGDDARTRDDQQLPVVYGQALCLTAYRITANFGPTDFNSYRFCDHAVKAVTGVWLDTERRESVAADNLDLSATHLGNGSLRVRNSAFEEPTQPPDVVYVDIIGRTDDGTTAGKAVTTPGEMMRHLLVAYGGTPPTRLVESTFRMLDRRWRYQFVPGVGRRPLAPRIGLVITGDMNVEDALTKICGDICAYWYVTRQGRVAVGVPDFDVGNLVREGGFEGDVDAFWSAVDGATFGTTSTRKYDGSRSAEVSNGSIASSSLLQIVSLPGGGTYVVTLLASLISGVSDKFRIGITGPFGVESLSEPMTLETGRWTRHSFVYEAVPGESGRAELRIYPAYGDSAPTTIAVDNVEMYRVACVVDGVRSIPTGLTFEEEHYYEASVTHTVNLQTGTASKRTITELEARGLSAALQPEGKYAVQSSTRAELTDVLAADADSAGGIAAAIALQYSRQRHQLAIEHHGAERTPIVGDYAFHRLNRRIPEVADEYPIWRICDVGYADSNAKVAKLIARRQIDLVVDRVDIAPDSVPMGAIVLTLSSGSMTDFSEVEALRNQYVAGHTTPDLATQRGSLFHRHSLSHVHPVLAHSHTITVQSVGLDSEGKIAPPSVYSTVEGVGKFGYPAPIGPQTETFASRGKSDGGHGHGLPSPLSKQSGAASGTSSPPNSQLLSAPGPNEPPSRRVRFMQRTGNTTQAIHQDLIIGIRSTVIPAGWQRVNELNGFYIRGAGTLGAFNTTTTGTFAPNDNGSVLPLANGSGAVVGRRLTVEKDGARVTVVVTVANGNTPTVVPLHLDGDVANENFPTGSGATVTAESQLVGTATGSLPHAHGGVMPVHTHNSGGHVHSEVEFVIGSADNSISVQGVSPFGHAVRSAVAGHFHSVKIAPLPDNTPSGTAGGTISGAVEPMPGYFDLTFIRPIDGNQTTIPVNGVLFWAQSEQPPTGYRVLGAAKDLLIRGTPDGSAVSAGRGGHRHQQSNEAHSMEHDHGGVAVGLTGPDSAFSGYTLTWENSSNTEDISVASWRNDTIQDGGHGHPVVADVDAASPGLSATSHQTGDAINGMPWYKQLVLIQKD